MASRQCTGFCGKEGGVAQPATAMDMTNNTTLGICIPPSRIKANRKRREILAARAVSAAENAFTKLTNMGRCGHTLALADGDAG
jgi:hypothetical protein